MDGVTGVLLLAVALTTVVTGQSFSAANFTSACSASGGNYVDVPNGESKRLHLSGSFSKDCTWIFRTAANYYNPNDFFYPDVENDNYKLLLSLQPVTFSCRSRGCECGYLEVFDGNSSDSGSLGRVCSRVGSRQFYSSGQFLTLKLHVARLGSYFDFYLLYGSMRQASTLTTGPPPTTITGDTSVCSDYSLTLYAEVGQAEYLTSPNYPNSYANFAECKWLLVTYSFAIVKVTILDASLERCTTCGLCDYLQLYDGPSENSTSLGTVCSIITQRVFYSSGQNLYIRFHTDNSVTDSGFYLRYEALYLSDVPTTTGGSLTSTTTDYNFAGGSLTSTTTDYNFSVCSLSAATLFAVGQPRYLSSPNYPEDYHNNANCRWLIYAYTHPVKVTFLSVSMEDCISCCDYVEIFDDCFSMAESASGSDGGSGEVLSWNHGMSESSPSLGKVCRMSSQTVFYSSGVYLYIKFTSDAALTSSGFRLSYEALTQQDVSTSVTPTKSVCSADGQTLFAAVGEVGYLTSPFYPNDYNSNADCRWQIFSGSYDLVVEVTVQSASMETCSSCCDYVQIFDGMSDSHPRLIKFCSMPSQTAYYSTGQYLYIKFTSDSSLTSSGFSLMYEAVDRQYALSSGAYRYQYESHTVAAIVGGVLGTAFLVVVIILIYIVRCRRRQQRPANTYLYNSGSTTTNNAAYLNNPPAYSSVYVLGAPPAYPGTVTSYPVAGVTNMAYVSMEPPEAGAGAGLSVTQEEGWKLLPPAEDNAPPVYSDTDVSAVPSA